jgi:predicted ferric reductase
MTSLNNVKPAGMNDHPNGDDNRVVLQSDATVFAGDVSSWRLAGRAWGVTLAVLYPLLLITPLCIFVALNPDSGRSPAAEVGADCAVVGLAVLAMQFVIAARLRWIEAPFGLDVLMAFHKSMAFVAAALLLTHPLLVAWGEGWSLLTRWHSRWYLWAGRAALLLLILHIAISLGRRAMRLRYELWRRIHTVAAMTIVSLGFVHSAMIGQDLGGGGGDGRGWIAVWSALAAIALGAWLHHRVVRPTLLRRRRLYCVQAVAAEAPRVWTLTLRALGGQPLKYLPGQFQFLRLFGDGTSSQEHPFSIASSPTNRGNIQLTVKECGDFTSQLVRVRPGDFATVHGPFGRFSYTLHPPVEELVFVAAGVGVTPLMSMLRHMRDCQPTQRVLLIYASRSLEDVVFADELKSMAAGITPLLKVIYVLSSPPPGWPGQTGRLDADRLVRLCGDLKHKAFYICCPPPMTVALIRGLKRLGVGPRHIHADYFSL